MSARLNCLIAMLISCLNPVYSSGQNSVVQEVADLYKNENAIVWSSTEHLKLSFENGKLVGTSTVEHEILLLTDRAAAIYNTDDVYHGFHHTLDNIEAETLQPTGKGYKTIKAGSYKTTHVNQENIFYDDFKQTEVTFTNLSRYARTRLNYTIFHSDIHFLTPFNFQEHMPTRFASFTLTVPKSVTIGYLLHGLHSEKVKMTTDEGRNEITYTWTVENMPGARKFEDAPDLAYSVPHIAVYVKQYEDPQTGKTRHVLSSVADLYHWYYKFVRDVDTKANPEMASIVDSLTRNISDPRKKAAHIYKWVQDHMRYVAYEDSMGGFVPRPSGLVCTRRFGDCKDMASLLVAMCRKAGLTAYFAWIGTRNIPYTYEELPTPITDNHMICMLKVDGTWIFMDGTSRNMPFGMPPAGLQGKQALVSLDSASYEIVPVPIAAAENNIVTDTTSINIRGNDVEGNMAAHYSGYGAYHYDALMLYSSGSDREKLMKRITSRGSDNYTQQSTEFLPGKNDKKDCGIKASFKLPGYARSIGTETYINLNLQRNFAEDFIDKSVREVPVEYSYKQHLKQVVRLKIPDGYSVSYLPADKSDNEPSLWGYKFHYEHKGNEILLVKDFQFNTILEKPDQFSLHNRLVEGIRDAYKESVVLSKNK